MSCLSKFRVGSSESLELGADSRRLIANSSGALAVAFAPATAKQVFTIAMTDYFASLVLPQLLPILPDCTQYRSPNCAGTNINAASLLEQSEIDIALGVFFRPSLRLRVQELNRDRHVCIMRRGHPLPGRN